MAVLSYCSPAFGGGTIHNQIGIYFSTSREHRSALTGLGASILCLLVFGSSRFLIPAMILITILLSVPFLAKRSDPEEENGTGTKEEMQ